jgi:putative ABC transport system ATP-binding protein
MLGLLDEPTSGDYLLEGRNVAKLTDAARSVIRCKQIGIIFQSFNLFPHFSILENVCMPMRFAGVERHEMKARASELLTRVGLGDRLAHSPSQLSGGQCQRVAIARALANSPSVILADEPTGNLDEKTGNEILAIFHELVDEGHTVIMVTHNAEYEKEVQRIIELHDGNVVRQ